MKKRLIGPHNVSEFIHPDMQSILLDSDMILSPGAKDILRSKGVSIIYGTQQTEEKDIEQTNTQQETAQDDAASLVVKVIQILRKDFGIHDSDQIREVSLLVMQKLTTT